MSVKRKVTVPDGRLFMCFLQRKRHGFFHSQTLSLGGKPSKLSVIQMRVNNFQITFYRSLLHRRATITNLFTHHICPSEESSGALGLSLICVEACVSFYNINQTTYIICRLE